MSPSNTHETLDVVLFSAGGYRAGFEAREVRASRPAPAAATGSDVETLLGMEPSTGIAARQHLLLKHADGDREILVGAPVDLVSLSVGNIHPLPPLLAARCQLKNLRALAIASDNGAETLILLFGSDTLSQGDAAIAG